MAVSRPRQKLQSLVAYAIAFASTCLILTGLLKLWKLDLHTPLQYNCDGLHTAMLIKAIHDHGWYLNNPRLGMPVGQAMHDFPLADSFHLLVCKAIDFCVRDWALTFNLYFLLTFPA